MVARGCVNKGVDVYVDVGCFLVVIPLIYC